MRITGTRMIDMAAAATSKNQTAVGDASNQLTSGKRVNDPSDDPTAWVAAQRVKLHQALSQGAGAAEQTSRDQLQLTDGSLSAIGQIVAQVRTLAVQGASDTYNAAGRAGIGEEVRGLFQTALASANAQGNDGEFLLAGAASKVAPFDAAGAYQGDASVRSVPGGTSTPVTVAGSSLTAASGVDILPLLSKIATALSANDMPSLTAALPDLDTAVKQISSARSQTGAAMNAIDQSASQRAQLEVDMQGAISKFVEADTVSAASDLAKATQALQLSQTVSAKIVALLNPST
jgi:flagellar hook-associated protein 3 FlgL